MNLYGKQIACVGGLLCMVALVADQLKLTGKSPDIQQAFARSIHGHSDY